MKILLFFALSFLSITVQAQDVWTDSGKTKVVDQDEEGKDIIEKIYNITDSTKVYRTVVKSDSLKAIAFDEARIVAFLAKVDICQARIDKHYTDLIEWDKQD